LGQNLSASALADLIRASLVCSEKSGSVGYLPLGRLREVAPSVAPTVPETVPSVTDVVLSSGPFPWGAVAAVVGVVVGWVVGAVVMGVVAAGRVVGTVVGFMSCLVQPQPARTVRVSIRVSNAMVIFFMFITSKKFLLQRYYFQGNCDYSGPVGIGKFYRCFFMGKRV